MARVRLRLDQRLRRRRLARVLVLVAASLGALVTGLWLFRARPQTVATAGSGETTISLLTPESVVAPDPQANERSFSLRKGGARFSVHHDASRPFRVHVDELVIEDLGARCTVVRTSAQRAEVAVEEGNVRVVAPGTVADLAAGERRVFDTRIGAAGAAAQGEAPPAEPLTGAPASPSAAPAPSRNSLAAWRPLAQNGQYGEAYDSLSRVGRGGVRENAGDLLLAADTARLSGHPAEAVPYLEQVVRSHAHDPRAPLASFTLGRVLLDELGRPRDAAAAFERARASAPLAEDALAREVEAFSRAGDTARAHELAQEYDRRYPQGRRATAVAKFGGLE